MKKVLFVLCCVAFMACNNENTPDTPALATDKECFDVAIEGEYSYGYEGKDMTFEYFYNAEYDYWGGFALSTKCDTDMANGLFANQYSVYNAAAASGDNFLLYYYDSYSDPCDIVFKSGVALQSVKLNLTTYTYASITDETINDFARAFGEGDFLKVVFMPLSDKGSVAGSGVECYIVDYREGKRFVANDWQEFDLANLTGAYGVRVVIETSDVGDYGANTPLYVAMDDLTYTLL